MAINLSEFTARGSGTRLESQLSVQFSGISQLTDTIAADFRVISKFRSSQFKNESFHILHFKILTNSWGLVDLVKTPSKHHDKPSYSNTLEAKDFCFFH